MLDSSIHRHRKSEKRQLVFHSIEGNPDVVVRVVKQTLLEIERAGRLLKILL